MLSAEPAQGDVASDAAHLVAARVVALQPLLRIAGVVRLAPRLHEVADGGTIFLDDIDDMPMSVQVKLLRVLQEREFERVGGEDLVQVDIRVVTATKVPLLEHVREGKFREDLYYRLNVVPVNLPGLRDREADVPLLVRHFIEKLGGGRNYTVKTDVLEAMSGYSWPGNVRELENAVQRALVMAKGDAILLENLPPEVLNVADAASPDVDGDDLAGLASKLFRWARNNPDLKVIPAVERELVINALKETDGNQVQSAKLLGITRATLRKRIEKFDIKQGLTVE